MVKINRLICCNRKFFVPDFKLSPKPFGLIRRQLYSKFKRELVKLTTTLDNVNAAIAINALSALRFNCNVLEVRYPVSTAAINLL